MTNKPRQFELKKFGATFQSVPICYWDSEDTPVSHTGEGTVQKDPLLPSEIFDFEKGLIDAGFLPSHSGLKKTHRVASGREVMDVARVPSYILDEGAWAHRQSPDWRSGVAVASPEGGLLPSQAPIASLGPVKGEERERPFTGTRDVIVRLPPAQKPPERRVLDHNKHK